MSRVQCKGCDYKPSEYDTLEGYCMTCAADRIKMSEQSDHDLLICINTKLKTLTKHFENHIKHHWMVTIPLISIVGGLVVTLIITLVKLL